MTAHRIPLPDWRKSINGLPLAAITEHGIKSRPKSIEEMLDEIDHDAALQERIDETREKIRRIFNPPCEAQDAVEGVTTRLAPNRFRSEEQ